MLHNINTRFVQNVELGNGFAYHKGYRYHITWAINYFEKMIYINDDIHRTQHKVPLDNYFGSGFTLAEFVAKNCGLPPVTDEFPNVKDEEQDEE